jgi:exopolyphosphatase/guanosine-5'-triphosphate,3'-diphosphate pyrophosphatase
VKPVRRAVIDVGTNSVKLLVAEVRGHAVQPLHEESTQTRLGRGFYDTQRLQPEAIAATAQAVAAFAATARAHHAATIRVIATSAAREAINSAELTEAITRAAGLPVEVISGEQEADFGFQGVTTDPELARATVLLMDVGGGSTEFILGRGTEKYFRESFPLGTVRLMETCRVAEPPSREQLDSCLEGVREFLGEKVRARLGPALKQETAAATAQRPLVFVGVGGTATIFGCMENQLAAFDRAKVEATRLSLERVKWHVHRLWGLPLEERKQVVGLPKNRADVILTGVAIYLAVMEEFALPELRISTRGLRFAAMMDAV